RALELVDRDRHGLDDAHDVGELELDEPDALGLGAFDLLDAGHRLVGCYHRSCLLMVVRAARTIAAMDPSGAERSTGSGRSRRSFGTESGSDLAVLHESDSDGQGDAELRIREPPAGHLLDPPESVGDGVAVDPEGRGGLVDAAPIEERSKRGDVLATDIRASGEDRL